MGTTLTAVKRVPGLADIPSPWQIHPQTRNLILVCQANTVTMIHFGIICPPATGHLNPLTTLGSELQSRGHRVTVVNVLDAEKKQIPQDWSLVPLSNQNFHMEQSMPMVTIPITNDQPGVAARIAWTGCGEKVKLSGLTVAKLRSAIVRVLTQDSYRNHATRLQTANQQAGGIVRAGDIIEQSVWCC